MKNKSFMKILSALLAVVMVLCAAPLNGFVGLELPELFSIEASAVTYSGSCGTNVNWSLDTDTGALNITGTGAMKNYSYYSSAPWYSYRSYVKSVNIQNGVTSIGNYAFYACDNLTSVTIPDSVTSIGEDAFYACDNLTSVTIPDSVTSIGTYAFYCCTSLTSVTIPDSVTSIGTYAFYYCTNLTSVTIGDSVTSIGSSAFSSCYSLTDVYYTGDMKSWCGITFGNYDANPMYYAKNFYIDNTLVKEIVIPDTVTEIKQCAFLGFEGVTSVTIGDSVTSIGYAAFYDCDGLTSVTIPDSVTSIGTYAFYYCTSLTSVTIPDSVTSIGNAAFYNCESLTSVTIPDNVTSIGKKTFYNCQSLISVTIPDSVTSIGDYAFYDCRSLTSVTIPDSVTSIGDSAFSGCTNLTSVTIGDSVTSIGDSAFYYCESLTSVTIPDSVTSIGDSAFSGCTNLTSVTISDSVTSIGNAAFYNCESLTSVTIPDNVTSIGEKTFYNCQSLISVTIPDSVTSIGTYAFYNCTNLISVTIGDSVTSIGDSAFAYCTNLVNVYYTGDMKSWCGITFDSYNANPMYYAKNFYIDNTLVKEIVIPDTVTEIKPYAFHSFGDVTSVTIPDSVTSIGSAAFSYCTNLISVTIGDSVTSIGYYAFTGCTNLVNVYYTGDMKSWCGITFDSYDANPMYYAKNFYIDNTLVKEIVIPDTVTEIKPYAFHGFEGVTSVTIPDSVTSIVYYAFSGCTNLVNVYYTGDMKSWCNISFSSGDANPLYYAENFYIDNTLVKEIVIPDTVTGIKRYAFCGFKGVTSVTIPDSVTSIGDSAFSGCTNLTSVTIGDSVTSIGDSAFYNCTGIKELTMPVSAKIYNSVDTFCNCTNIEKVTFTKGTGVMRNYGNSTSSSATETYYKYTPWYISRNKIQEIVIEDGVTIIGTYAFMDCTGLVTLTIPSEVMIVRENAFYGCNAIGKVYFLGTEEEWNEVVIREGNDPILNAKKIFIPEGHEHQYDEFVSVEPTCIKEGMKTLTCSCGESYTEKIPATGHTESEAVEEKRIEATCIKDGSYDTVIYCTTCKVEISRETTKLPATGHGEKIFASETLPTCTETGMRYYKCSVCGFDGTKIVYSTSECPQSPHNYSNNANFTKTFSSPGAEKLILKFSSQTQVENRYDYIYIYNGDGSLYGKYTGTVLAGETIELESDSFSIKLTSDSSGTYYGYSFDSITAIVTPGKEYCEEIPATGHTESKPVEENKTEPTCTEDGSYDSVVYCTVCEAEISRETIVLEATGHTESKVVEENRVEPTCTESGSYDSVIYCSVCKEELSRETIVLEAFGHTESDAIEENRVEPTCTEEGSYDTVVCCLTCGVEVSRVTESISPKGHSWGKWEITILPTLTTDGVKVRECSACGKGEEGIVPKTGITIVLTDSEGNVVNKQVIDGGLTDCTFEGIEDGEYMVTILKETYATREYIVTAKDGKVEVEFTLNHIGDINGDGKISVLDYTQLLRHVKKTSTLDGYAFDCADVNGDGKLSVLDYTKLLRHVKKTETLW